MGFYDSEQAITTDLTNSIDATELNSQDTDTNNYTPQWSKWHGIYREVPELATVIDKIGIWSAGAEKIKAKDKNKQSQLDKIKGIGKESFRDIVINLIRTATICGDSFAELIYDKAGRLINIKVLSPGTIEIENDDKGMIINYKQITLKDNPNTDKKEKMILNEWQPDEILHLSWNRIADETHGISTIEKLQQIIVQRKECHTILQKYFRRILFPARIIETDFDDETKMQHVKTQYQTAIENGEVQVVPKGSIEIKEHNAERLIEDAMNWPYYLAKYFVASEGVPEVIMGSITETSTEGASKILYLAFEQVVKNKQIWFEESFRVQTGIEIDLPAPPTIDPSIILDSRKAGSFDASKGQNSMTGKQNLDPAGIEK